MVLRGWFARQLSIDGANGDLVPYVRAQVLIKDVGAPVSVQFIVDTGSSKTFLSHADALRSGVNFTRFVDDDRKAGTGIGGDLDYYDLPGSMLFQAGGQFWKCDLDIGITCPTCALRPLPSLLGRDILNAWECITYRPQARKLEFVVSDLNW